MEEKKLNEIVIVEQLPIIKEKLQIISDEIDKEVEYALLLPCNEETIKEVKNARARLNKIKTSLEDRRKQVKNAVMNPYNEFETVYNELVKDKLSKADKVLKESVDAIEELKKNEKTEELKEFVEEHCKANNVHVDFERIGLNITLSASMKSLKEQAKTFIENVANDLKLIDMEEYKDEILLEYQNDFNFVNAKTKVIERHKQLEEIKKQQEEKQNIEQQEQQIIENVEEAIEITAPVEIEQKETYEFKVKATKTQIKQLIEFMKSIDIEYE